MTSGVFGGGVIFVVAALLWAAVLVPSWVRRREFKSAERNAVRLQRTLRVLAETAEVPTEVRVEATAREALAKERLLRTAQRQQEAERRAELAEARAAQVRAEIHAQRMRRAEAALGRSARLRRPAVRRLRALAALCTLLALAAVLVGFGFLAAGQGYALLAVAGLAAIASIGALVLMAPGRVRVGEIPEERVVGPADVAPPAAKPIEPASDPREAALAHAAAQAEAAARIERARAMARARAARPAAPAMRNRAESMLLERDGERPAEAVAAPVSAAVPASTPAVSSGQPAPAGEAPASGPVVDPAAAARREKRAAALERLRGMGVVGDTSDGALDLDTVLRSRRRVG